MISMRNRLSSGPGTAPTQDLRAKAAFQQVWRAWLFLRALISARCFSSSMSKRRARRMAIARSRFFIWLRSSVQKMRMPVGLCIRSTAVSTLFTFCPPAPPDLAVVSSMSCKVMECSVRQAAFTTPAAAIE